MTVTDKQKDLPIMYWLPKIHKTIGCRFIVASDIATLNQSLRLSAVIFLKWYTHMWKVFITIIDFLITLNNFGSFRIILQLLKNWQKLILKRMLKWYLLSISVYTFYTAIPHNVPIKVLNEVLSFVFNYKNKAQVGFHKFWNILFPI